MPQQPIKIYRQKRRNLMMRAIPGMIEVFIPYQLQENASEVQDFIANGLKQLDGKMPPEPPEKTSRQRIRVMIDAYARQIGVQASRIQFRDMLRKWGSCSSRGSITLNTRLTWLEPELVEYVVCHELVHLIELNHSQVFWSLLEKHMPDYKQRLEALRQIEKTLW